MKRYIKDSKNESINEIIIDVQYLYLYEAIAASKEHINSRIEIREFRDFVNSVNGSLHQRNFIVEDAHRSDRDEKYSLSYYISFYLVDENKEIIDKFIIHLRLSNHDIEDFDERSRKYHQTMAERYKRSNNRYQMYRAINIVVDTKENSSEFNSYGSALEYLNNLFDSMEEGTF